MAFDLSQLGGLLSGAGGAGLAGGVGGEGLLGGQPGLLDLIPAFQYQKGNLSVSFDPAKVKRDRLIRRLIEQQSGTRAPTPTTETAGGIGGILGGGGTNFVSAPDPFAQTSIPGFRGFGGF